MSLLRLLTAGKSLIGVQPVMGRYQMTDPRSMPKFGDGKNLKTRPAKVKNETPSPPAAERAEKAVTAPESFEKPGEVELSGAIDAAASPGTPMAGRSELSRATPPIETAKPAEIRKSGGSGKARRPDGWISKLGSLKTMLRARARPLRPARELLPVQGELSLDKIKVIRNDLSESDLEVVPLRSNASKSKVENAGKKVSEQALSVLGIGRE